MTAEYIIESDPDTHEIHLAGEGKRSRAVAYTEFYSRYIADYRFVFDNMDRRCLGPRMVHLHRPTGR